MQLENKQKPTGINRAAKTLKKPKIRKKNAA